MLAMTKRKSLLIGTLFFCLLFAIYFGSVYTMLRGADADVLVPLALGPGPIQQFVAKRDLWRQIRAGESNGVDALSRSLSLSTQEHFDEEAAIELARELLDVGADINGKGKHDFTPLHSAIILVQPNSVAFLLEHCADPGVPLTSGRVYSGSPMNALELAYLMESEYTHLDYSSVVEVLEQSEQTSNCTSQ